MYDGCRSRKNNGKKTLNLHRYELNDILVIFTKNTYLIYVGDPTLLVRDVFSWKANNYMSDTENIFNEIQIA